MNKALKISCLRGLPVRVVRSAKEKRSSYAPGQVRQHHSWVCVCTCALRPSGGLSWVCVCTCALRPSGGLVSHPPAKIAMVREAGVGIGEDEKVRMPHHQHVSASTYTHTHTSH
jgi:hypothetical protein